MEGLTSQLPAPYADTTLKQVKQIEESFAKAIGTSSSGDANGGDDMGEGEGDGDGGDDDEGFDYYDYLLDDEDEDEDEDGYEEEDDSMQKQFDNVDLPPGVEAPVPWWKESDSTPASTDTVSSGLASQLCSSGSSSVGQSSTGNGNGKVESSDIIRKYQEFKHFDTVDDCSDHHFNNMASQGQQPPPKAWSKKIQSEWKILEKNLPDTIYVRVYESRMDLLRAVIVGPQGTPYHDGLFIFDVLLPSTYPDTPPVVYYYSGGLRLNPNLYECGKVCLSLLNTWTGKGTEKWQPNTSTMLQVLVSIQGLILNENPFFNEPGYESSYVGAEGERRSKAYSENVFVMSLKTMMYTLKRPPRHFEDLVAGHFHIHAHDILSACKAYREGAPVGFADRGKPEGDNVPEHGRTRDFKAALTKITNVLVSTFTKYGVKDCEQFRITG